MKIKCGSCSFLVGSLKKGDCYCTKLRTELENGYAMVFHSESCGEQKVEEAN
jgi:hypothetical protein